jgi:hypothetical protein
VRQVPVPKGYGLNPLKECGHLLALLLLIPVALASDWVDNNVSTELALAVCFVGAGLVWLVAYWFICWKVEP